MILLHRNPGDTADAIVKAVAAGQIRTPGMWMDALAHIAIFPPRLQIHTMNRIRIILGPSATDYLNAWLPKPQRRRLAGVRN